MKPVFRMSISSLVVLLVSFSSLPNAAFAQQNSAAFEKTISKEVVAVASVDLTKVDLLKLNSWAAEVSLFPPGDIEELKPVLTIAQDAIDKLTKNGVQRISVLFRLSDFGAYSPLWVATVEKEDDVAEATEALKATLDIFQLDKRALIVRDGLIFGGPSQSEIDSLFAKNAAANRDLSAAIKMMNQHTAGVFVFGNQESRRVVREMLPNLPKPFNEATRELIAGDTDWGGLFLDFPPTADLKLIVQAKDKDSAQTIGRLSTAAIEYALRKSPPVVNEKLGETIRSKIAPKIIDRLTVLDAQMLLTDQKFIKGAIDVFQGATEPTPSEAK